MKMMVPAYLKLKVWMTREEPSGSASHTIVSCFEETVSSFPSFVVQIRRKNESNATKISEVELDSSSSLLLSSLELGNTKVYAP